MTLDGIWDFIKSVLAVAGGTSAVFLLFGKFAITKTVDAFEKRYDEKLNERLETHKAQLSTKEYISKTRFDTEFKIYQELSEKQITAVYNTGEAVMVARGMYGTDIKRYDEFVNRFCDSLNDAETSLKKYAPFISEEIYKKYKALDKQITDVFKLSLAMHDARLQGATDMNFQYGGRNYSMSTAKQQIASIQKNVSAQSDDIIRIVRKYLSGLDVIE